ncbi:MAG: hypothetical protein JW818_17305, partial [Pirellulales bacterium]|nr:hypothetical protein [Pirellulales bacterium]
PEQRKLVVVPEYFWQNIERPVSRHTFEEPVEVEVPKATDPEPPERRKLEHDVPIDRKPAVEPKTPQHEQPEPAKIRRAETNAACRANVAAGAQIRRQPWKHRPVADVPMPQPQASRPAQREPVTPSASVAAVKRQPTEVRLHQREVFDSEPIAAVAHEVLNPARRTRQQKPSPDRPTTPVPTRQLAQTADAARSRLPLPAKSLPKPTPAAQPVAAPTAAQSATAVAKSGDTAPRAARSAVAAPTEEPSAVAAAIPRASAGPAPSPITASKATMPERSALSEPRQTLHSVAEGPLPRQSVPTGRTPESRLRDVGSLAVTRTSSAAPLGERPAAIGAAESAVGSGQITAQLGQPRARDDERAMLTGNSNVTPLPRSATSGVATQAIPLAAAMPAPEAAPTSSPGESTGPTANASATTLARGGSRRVTADRPGSGADAENAGPGGAEPIGLARVSRTSRLEASVSATSGGQSPSRSPTPGLAWVPAGAVESPQIAAAGPIAGQGTGSPVRAEVGGLPRQSPSNVLGGSRPGALASLELTGQPVRAAVGRRAVASQPQSAGSAPSAQVQVTMARADSGVRLPALADVSQELAQLGAGAVGSGRPASPASGESGSGGPLHLGPPTEAGRVGGGAPGRVALAGQFARAASASPATDPGPASVTPGTLAGPRRLPDAGKARPILAADAGGGPIGREPVVGLPRGLDLVVADEPAASGTADGPSHESPGVAPTPLDDARPAGRAGGLPVLIAARPGPGGLSYEVSPEVGIPSQTARPESEEVHVAPSRFLLKRAGGTVAINGRVHELPAEAFRQRDPGQRARAVEIYGGTEGTERAVELGLEFLVRYQFPDGHWSIDQFPEGTDPGDDPGFGIEASNTAATGLALLSFLGAGYTHQSDKHRATVRRGLDWLLDAQKPNGDLFTGGSGSAWLYSHGIATIALCEAYGMTHDPRLREPAQKAIQFIVDAQDTKHGGWRYQPNKESDTSVSGWQLMALKSAQMAGLKVPPKTLDGVSRWLDLAQADAGTRYVYNPNAGDTFEQRAGRRPSLAMTAEGTLMRLYLGQDRSDPTLRGAADYLQTHLPQAGSNRENGRDVYYWYYATQVMFQMQGDHWAAWNGRLHPLLVSTQTPSGPMSGSWHPTRPVRDRWGHAGGRLYVTTMNLLMLEVYYRHLPLFKTL